MRKYAFHVFVLILVTFGLSLAFCHSAAAMDTIYYFKLDTAYQDVNSDDFDGNGLGRFESNENVGVVKPDIDKDGYGFGFTFGGIIGHWGGELYFRQTKHNGSYFYSNDTYDMDFYEIGGNVKYYFVEFDRSTLNGYVLAGMAYTKLKAEDAGVNTEGEFDEAIFNGKTYNLGLGGTCRFGDHFGLEAQYIYGFNHIMTVRTMGEKANRFEDLKSETQVFNLGVNYYF